MLSFFHFLSPHKSWWVFACAIVCFSFYEKATKPLSEEKYTLLVQEKELKAMIEEKLLRKQEQEMHIARQNDPEWIEQLLIQHLGLVPEGYTKIYYEGSS